MRAYSMTKQLKVFFVNVIFLSLFMFISIPVFASDISSFKETSLAKSLALQRLIDINEPMSKNNIFGTHNSYNSESYSSYVFKPRYVDPQQKYTIKQQLEMGARFIEIDAHWTLKEEKPLWGIIPEAHFELLMSHGEVPSIFDKYFTEGLDEIKSWLNSSDSDNQVIIFLIEDWFNDNDAGCKNAYVQLNQYFGEYIYKSYGTGPIPDNLTKKMVLEAGKKVVIWSQITGDIKSYDRSVCTNYKNTVFTSLGNITRESEDRTGTGTIANGSDDWLTYDKIVNYIKGGTNIIALDLMAPPIYDDNRLTATLWSWGNGEPSGDGHCVYQNGEDGRWNDDRCSDEAHYACKNSTGNWAVTGNSGAWYEGQAKCAALDGDFKFSIPTNAKDNQALFDASHLISNTERIWMNSTDEDHEGDWTVNGNSTNIMESEPDAALRETIVSLRILGPSILSKTATIQCNESDVMDVGETLSIDGREKNIKCSISIEGLGQSSFEGKFENGEFETLNSTGLGLAYLDVISNYDVTRGILYLTPSLRSVAGEIITFSNPSHKLIESINYQCVDFLNEHTFLFGGGKDWNKKYYYPSEDYVLGDTTIMCKFVDNIGNILGQVDFNLNDVKEEVIINLNTNYSIKASDDYDIETDTHNISIGVQSNLQPIAFTFKTTNFNDNGDLGLVLGCGSFSDNAPITFLDSLPLNDKEYINLPINIEMYCTIADEQHGILWLTDISFDDHFTTHTSEQMFLPLFNNIFITKTTYIDPNTGEKGVSIDLNTQEQP